MTISSVSDRDLLWLVIVHVVFVVSSVLLALSDKIAGASHHGKPKDNGGNDHAPRSNTPTDGGSDNGKDKPIMIA